MFAQAYLNPNAGQVLRQFKRTSGRNIDCILTGGEGVMRFDALFGVPMGGRWIAPSVFVWDLLDIWPAVESVKKRGGPLLRTP
jgi:hypothetical protein